MLLSDHFFQYSHHHHIILHQDYVETKFKINLNIIFKVYNFNICLLEIILIYLYFHVAIVYNVKLLCLFLNKYILILILYILICNIEIYLDKKEKYT